MYYYNKKTEKNYSTHVCQLARPLKKLMCPCHDNGMRPIIVRQCNHESRELLYMIIIHIIKNGKDR